MTAEHLAAITSLSLEGAGITTLKAGDFAGLSALTELFLVGNPLDASAMTLLAGLPTAITAITNASGGICARTFAVRTAIVRDISYRTDVTDCASVTTAHLAAIRSLGLYDAGITTLKAGDFADLSALEFLDLEGNPLDASAMTLLAGLPATVTAITNASGICTRTAAVRNAIVRNINTFVPNCTSVTTAHLAAITSLSLRGAGITTLKAGDFAGLSALTSLDLRNNQISTLPTGIFSDLSKLTGLFLAGNQISTPPAGAFSDLTGLFLAVNQISRLPDGIFTGLSRLTELDLRNNQISTLPDGIFSGLSALEFLDLDDNQLSRLPAGVFSDLSALTELNLNDNQISTLPAGVFSDLSALTELNLNDNQISRLPAGVFSDLSALTELDLVDNPLDASAMTLLADLPTTITISASPVAVGADRVNTLAKISAYAQTDGSPVPTVMDYTDAGVTGVTTNNLEAVNAAVLASTAAEADTLAEIQTLAAPAIMTAAALAKISAYAADDSNDAPTLMDYTDAGVMGVTIDNLDIVNAAVAAASTATEADTLAEIQTLAAPVIMTAAALAKISAYAADDSNDAPTLMDYTDAGVMGVTTNNLEAVNAAVLASTAALTSTSAVQTLVDPAINMVAALAKISAYAQTDGSPVPTVMDYTDAGVMGVTTNNLEAVNAAVLASTAALTSTSAVQTLVDPAINMAAALAKISAYAQTDGSPMPTVMDYTDAGVTGVTIDNLDIVNAAVLASSAALTSTSAVQTLVDPAINMAAALAKISAYAQTDGSPVPTVMDYSAVGVTGVTIDNLDIVNAAVAAVSATEADTTDKIQALVTKAVEIVERIKQLNTAIMPRLTQAMLGTTLASISSRLDGAFSGATQSNRGQLDGVSLGAQPIVLASFLQKLPSYVDSLKEDNTNWRRILANSSFTLSPQDAQSGSAKGLTVWGIGDYSSLGDKDNSLDWDGEVFTVQLGIDKQLSHNLLVGGLVSWSDGDVDADLAGIERSSYKHRMISVHPYLAWSGKHAQLWGSLGYGQGKLKIGLGNNNPSLDTRLVSMVAGGEGRLSNRLSLKSDIALAQTDIDGSNLSTQQDTDSQRLRLLLKADLISRGHYTATLEAGARYDNGDGDSGLGAVLDASMAYNNPAKGLTVGAKLHTLLGRDDYSEWGLSGLLELATKANGRGLAFSLSPSYSLATQDDSQAIWQENQLDSANNLYAADQQMQLDTRLSYGLLAFATQGLLTPYSEVTFGDTNRYRLGIHWQGNNRLDLDLFGEHRESHSRQDDQAIMLKGKFRF